MDSQQSIAEQVKTLVQSRRFRAFGIACLVLSTLVVLQVGSLNRNTPMCELLGNCPLANGDLQRMQIALSQSGLSEFKITDKRLLVPTAQHAIYLQAIAEKNAIPQELRESEETGPSINPFLSRSQQLSIERAAKKKQIREMVVRLPFVEQAWFEMDQSDTRSAFEQAKQSAVISIRTPQHIPLNDQQVDTVKRMIGGAVAGLDPSKIVVIDLSMGFAHQEPVDPLTTEQGHYQRIAFEQQRYYENRIREALQDYPGLKVTVHVDVQSGAKPDKITSTGPALIPTTLAVPTQVPAPIPNAGANSTASLKDFDPAPIAHQSDSSLVEGYQVEWTSHDESANVDSVHKEISVSIDVPQKLVHDLFGLPTVERSKTRSQSEYQAALANDTQTKFEQLQSEIIQKIRSAFPASSMGNPAAFPIVVNLIRQPLPPDSGWSTQVKQIAAQHWPSAAVLVIGLMLLTIVTRNPDPVPATVRVDQNVDHDVLSIDSRQTNVNRLDDHPEVRLSNLIEKDPDAAAKVIEAWIRDAA